MIGNNISIEVNQNFRKKLTTIGETVHLTYFRFKKSINSEGVCGFINDYTPLCSLWNEDSHTLSATFSLNDLWGVEDSINSATLYIEVYYTSDKGILEGTAFTLGDVANPAYKGNSSLAGKRNDKIYVNIEFPEDIVANIECNTDTDYINTLEAEGAIPGVNYWLYGKIDQIKGTDLVIRDIALEYESSLKSDNNSEPFSLNSFGERIFVPSEYKHYKRIDIRARDLSSRVINDDKYFAGNILNYSTIYNTDIQITGQCIYDKYKVINGSYQLVDSDCSEDLSVTTLRSLNGTIGLGETYLVDSKFNEKIVKFSSAAERTYYIDSFLNFTAELDDEGEVLLDPTLKTISSNVIQFEVNSIWEVHYPSNLTQFSTEYQKNIVVMLFDYMTGSHGWNPGSYEEERSSAIHIFTDIKLNSLDDLTIESVIDRTGEVYKGLGNYFNWTLTSVYNDEQGQAQDELGRYKYEILFEARNTNNSSKWYPFLDNEDIVVTTIRPKRSWSTSIEPIRVICIQRNRSELELRTYSDTTLGTLDPVETSEINLANISRPFESEMSVAPSFTIASENLLPEFSYYEISYNSSEVYISKPEGNIGRLYGDGIKVSGGENFKIFFAPGFTGSSSTISISRKNSENNIDLNNWKDLVYCYGKEITLYSPDWLSNYNKTYRGFKKTFIDYFTFTPNGYSYKNCPLIVFDSFGGQVRFDLKYPKLNHGESEADSSSHVFGIHSIDISSNNSGKVEASIIEQESGGGIFITGNSLGEQTKSLFPSDSPIEISVRLEVYEKKPYGNVLVEFDEETDKETIKDYTTSIYIIYKPDLSDTLFAFDENENKLDSIVLSEDNKKTPFPLIVNYLGESVSDDYKYWRLRKNNYLVNFSDEEKHTDPEIHSIGSDNIIQLTLKNSNIALEDLELIHSYRKYYAGEIEYFRDWRNQIVYQDTSIIDLNNKGISRDNIVIEYDTIYGEREVIDQYLDLDYIGIYKIYVKLGEEFRVSLEETNKQEHFYFYNTSLDAAEYDILTEDIARTDMIDGIEVPFLFLGWEPDTFAIMSQQLRTTIKVSSLTSNKSYTINLRRRYWNTAKLNTPYVNTAIEGDVCFTGSVPEGDFSTEAKELFRSSDFLIVPDNSNFEGVSSHISFTSKLEADTVVRRFYEQISEATVANRFEVDKVSGKYVNGEVVPDPENEGKYCNPQFTDKSYFNVEERLLGNENIQAISRGYKGHSTDYVISSFPDSGVKYYPLPVVQSVDIMNPLDFNGEKRSLSLYQLGEQIYPKGSSDIVLINRLDAPGIKGNGSYGFTNNICPGEILYEYTYVFPDGTSRKKIDAAFSGDSLTFNIPESSTLDAPPRYKLVIYKGYQPNGSNFNPKVELYPLLTSPYLGEEDRSLGTLEITYRIKNTSFLYDSKLNTRNIPQDYVDYWVSPKTISINLTQLCPANSTDKISVSATEVGRFGELPSSKRIVTVEKRLSKFYFELVGEYSIISTNTSNDSKSTRSTTEDSIVYRPFFNSMIHKTGWPGPTPVSDFESAKTLINKFGRVSSSDITLKSNGSEPTTLVTSGITQRYWDKGLCISQGDENGYMLFMGFAQDLKPNPGVDIDSERDVFTGNRSIVWSSDENGSYGEHTVYPLNYDGNFDQNSVIVLATSSGEKVVVRSIPAVDLLITGNSSANGGVDSSNGIFLYDSNLGLVSGETYTLKYTTETGNIIEGYDNIGTITI